MEDNNIHTHMSMPRKRGRPTLLEQAERTSTEEPTPLPGKPPLFQCTRCGSSFEPRVYRTMSDGVRIMRCNKCGYSHPVTMHLLAKLKLP